MEWHALSGCSNAGTPQESARLEVQPNGLIKRDCMFV
jgi:hypothetical protein